MKCEVFVRKLSAEIIIYLQYSINYILNLNLYQIIRLILFFLQNMEAAGKCCITMSRNFLIQS